VPDKPKPMALVNGKPFLEYLLNYLARFGISHVVLSVGYKAEHIQNYVGSAFGKLKISYAFEKQPLGTGGGIQLALQETKTENIFILNGDTFFNVGLDSIEYMHLKKEADLTMALKKVEDASRYGTVITDVNSRIIEFREKIAGKKNALINGGIYLINKRSFLGNNFPEKFSFEKDFLEKQVGEKQFFGLPFDAYFIDIGLPETYKKAQTDFLDEFSEK
jgi:D-glycero-alpha-D-manno-heptose 1-phosphate guanylyltransferase